MSFVYILQSFTNQRYYIGSTDNLERRFIEHNEGKSVYTKSTRPFKLVFSQEFSTLTKARKMERKLKSYKSKRIIEQIVKDQKINASSD